MRLICLHFVETIVSTFCQIRLALIVSIEAVCESSAHQSMSE